MANPQKEDGHTSLAHEILEAMYIAPFSKIEYRILLFVLRKTYGWQKKKDKISLSQFDDALPDSIRNIIRGLKDLVRKNVLFCEVGNGRSNPSQYQLNKDYEAWKFKEKISTTTAPKKIRRPKVKKAEARARSSEAKKPDPPQPPKVEIKIPEEAVVLANGLLDCIIYNNANFRFGKPEKRPATIARWSKEIDLMMRIDGRSFDDIKFVIKSSQVDPFWRQNILSAAKLREQFDQLWLKFKSSKVSSPDNSGRKARRGKIVVNTKQNG